MAWVHIDDKMPENLKIDPLSDAAFRLHVSGICYCNRLTTDGHVPDGRPQRLVPRYRASALRELTDAGLWVPDGDGGWRIHDYLDWQKSRAQIEAESERQRARARKRWGGDT